MTTLWMELRRSPVRLWFPVFLAITFAILFGRGVDWAGSWLDASAAAQLPAVAVAVVLAAATASAAARARRDDERRGVDASTWRIEATRLGAALSYGLGAYVIGHAVAAAVVLFSGAAGPGFLWPGYLVMGAIVVIGAAGIGQFVGNAVGGTVIVPVILGVAVLFVFSVLSAAFDLSVRRTTPYFEVSWSALLPRVGVAVFLCATAVTRPRRVGSDRRSPVRVASLGLLASVIAIGVVGSVIVPRVPPSPECTRTVPRLCVWPERHGSIPTLTAMAERMAALPEPFVVPETLSEIGLSGVPADRDFDGFVFADGDSWRTAGALAGAVAEATPALSCEGAADPEWTTARNELTYWARTWIAGEPWGDGSRTDDDLRFVEDMAAHASPEAQFDWVENRWESVAERDC
ncbi:hypothetical protein [Stackebrandtia soli]|uniref:hypothetical protein n=1 Tax=Stackebrandtia soli TaxID=1892856 RepID=UPI0039ECA414